MSWIVRLRWLGTLLLLTTALFLNFPAAAAEECKGAGRLEHKLGQGFFVTTSRVYEGSGVHFYVTCVENHGDKDLWINWFVPGPNSYIPPGEALESPRYFQTRENAEYKGCLEYGSLGESLKAQFIGHVSDGAQIQREDGGCDQANPFSTYSTSSSVIPFRTPLEIYFPSDASKPEATMLRMEASAGVEIEGKTLISTFRYSIAHASKEQAGRPEDVRIVPLVTDDSSKFFYQAFSAKFDKGGIGLKEKDEINILFDGMAYERDLSLTSIRYGIIDRTDKVVAALFVPMWTPRPAQ